MKDRPTSNFCLQAVAAVVMLMGSLHSAAQSRETNLDKVKRCSHGQQNARLGDTIRIVTWNIERGLEYGGIVDFLRQVEADVLLLQEVDVNARRSDGRAVHEDLSRELRMNCVFGAEFEELGQRATDVPALQGQAILTRVPIEAGRILRFKTQTDYWRPRWYLPNSLGIFQRRIGGRLALVAEIEMRSGPLVLYNVHLESRGKENFRLRQVEEVLEDVKRYPEGTAIVLAGDLNVEGADSPVIRSIESAGFRKAAGGEVTTERGAPLDWIFVRGNITPAADAKVHTETSAADHYPVSVTVSAAR